MTHPALANGPIYLDYNATTPVDPAVHEAALPYLTHHFGNPSSAHHYASEPRQALARARRQVADLLATTPEEIIFTAGGSEADTLAIRGAALAAPTPRRQLITLATEHPAVLQACRSLQADGFTTTMLPIDQYGRLNPADLEKAIGPGTALVSIAYGNSETGTLQPIAELAAIARRHGALFHTDAAQAAGKLPIDVAGHGVDLLTVVGHKMYAPKGIGALYLRSGVHLQPIIHGGGQEAGLRSGTENIALIVALGHAAELARQDLPGSAVRLAALRDLLQRELERLLGERVQLNGHPTQRLPGTLNVSIAGVNARKLLAAIPQIAAATGSACHEGLDAPSPVLLAMGMSADRATAALRLSLGRWTSEPQVRRAAELIAEQVTPARNDGALSGA